MTWDYWGDFADAGDRNRACGGRRHYNAMRRLRALDRQGRILSYCLDTGIPYLLSGSDQQALAHDPAEMFAPSPVGAGVQQYLAAHFGVHQSTISRDLAEIRRSLGQRGPLRMGESARPRRPKPHPPVHKARLRARDARGRFLPTTSSQETVQGCGLGGSCSVTGP